MHKILIASAVVLSLAGGPAALAATKAKTTPVAATSMQTSKSADCTKQWKAEKKHSQTRKAFMAACNKA